MTSAPKEAASDEIPPKYIPATNETTELSETVAMPDVTKLMRQHGDSFFVGCRKLEWSFSVMLRRIQPNTGWCIDYIGMEPLGIADCHSHCRLS